MVKNGVAMAHLRGTGAMIPGWRTAPSSAPLAAMVVLVEAAPRSMVRNTIGALHGRVRHLPDMRDQARLLHHCVEDRPEQHVGVDGPAVAQPAHAPVAADQAIPVPRERVELAPVAKNC